ncbi:hypothetical protein EDB85DRAFT_1417536 [Lactarius pseudohatsudake]|nr:hypothetical protein EDB85DRAFT_1417536 [Lactarius pseudohatsudake]
MAQWLLNLDIRLLERQGSSLVYDVPLTKPPALAPSLSPVLLLCSSGFALALVTAGVLASILNILATVSTFARKFWKKNEDVGSRQNGTFKTFKSCDTSTQRLQFGYTPRAARLVFDPGGSVFIPDPVHEDSATLSLFSAGSIYGRVLMHYLCHFHYHYFTRSYLSLARFS